MIVKVTKTYTIRSVERKFMGDTINDNKSATSKRRRLKKEIVIEEENTEIDEVGEGEEEIDVDVAAATKKEKRSLEWKEDQALLEKNKESNS